LPESSDSALLVGYNLADDAGVYCIGDEQALIQTVDFFTPIVDDPFIFGAIAAANALSDVYAMGGRPLTALNIVGFPHDQLETEVLNQILLGGHAKVQEAGAVLVGGHTVRDPELKYGLSVTGVVHPDRVVTNAGARPGDSLILTKKLGTGLIANAFKADQIGEDDMAEAVVSMTALNRVAAEQMCRFDVHACTDVTGFGLLGHAAEMAAASQVSLTFRAASVPMIDLALDLGAQPLGGGSRDNQLFLADVVSVDAGVPQARANVMFDAQTSGGLLIALPADQAEPLLNALRENGISAAAIIGEAIAGASNQIQVLP
jgi:selenide, water dikinase